MPKLHYTRRAREDLLDIWVYIAPRSPVTADRIFDAIDARCQDLRENPHLGPIRPDIAPDARALVVERWIVLYRLIEAGIRLCGSSMALGT